MSRSLIFIASALVLITSAGLDSLSAQTAARRSLRARPQPKFIGPGDLPGGQELSFARGISPCGRWVVGSGRSSDGEEAFLWHADTGMVGLGDFAGGAFGSVARSVSTGGGVVVGYGSAADGDMAFRWTPAGGMEALGRLPGHVSSYAWDVDAAGEIIVGYGAAPSGVREGWVWTATGGMLGLGHLPASNPEDARALAISADGSTIVGDSNSVFGPLGVRWVNGGPIEDIYPNGNAFVPISAIAVGLDGSLIGGLGLNSGIPEAYTWSANIMTGLGTLPDQTLGVQGISHDHRRIVGSSTNGSDSLGFYWSPQLGVRELEAVMTEEYGLIEPVRWAEIETATGISGDGNRIIGFGRNQQGNREAFLAFLPRACPADLNQDGVVNLADLSIFSAAHAGQTRLGDFDGDGLFTAQDPSRFMRAYTAGCN